MVLAVVLLYVIRLVQIQLIDVRYRNSADNNALYYRTIYPTRGVIYDRDGRMIVSNQPSFDVTVVMRNVRNLDTLAFCQSLDITRDYFESRMADIRNLRKNPGYSPYTEQVFMAQLSFEEISEFREKLFRFDGFGITQRQQRKYSYEAAAHLLGDLGEVSKSEMEDDKWYVQGDVIGKQGVEKYYEAWLRGEKGTEVLLKDAYGRIQGSYYDGEYDREAVPGHNLTLGLDIELQMLGEKLMQNKIGSSMSRPNVRLCPGTASRSYSPS